MWWLPVWLGAIIVGLVAYLWLLLVYVEGLKDEIVFQRAEMSMQEG